MNDSADFVLELGRILKGFADKDQTPDEAHAAGEALSDLIGNAKLRINGPAGERDALWMEDQTFILKGACGVLRRILRAKRGLPAS